MKVGDHKTSKGELSTHTLSCRVIKYPTGGNMYSKPTPYVLRFTAKYVRSDQPSNGGVADG
jgi:hypothetical protein